MGFTLIFFLTVVVPLNALRLHALDCTRKLDLKLNRVLRMWVTVRVSANLEVVHSCFILLYLMLQGSRSSLALKWVRIRQG